mmetsp:Transcript_67119/g.155794  ORF Transcript_67119/g.155794 Transcript_67119/m.155794 type:complete len:219 (+) Transcript_67119:423-1079(+)
MSVEYNEAPGSVATCADIPSQNACVHEAPLSSSGRSVPYTKKPATERPPAPSTEACVLPLAVDDVALVEDVALVLPSVLARTAEPREGERPDPRVGEPREGEAAALALATGPPWVVERLELDLAGRAAAVAFGAGLGAATAGAASTCCSPGSARGANGGSFNKSRRNDITRGKTSPLFACRCNMPLLSSLSKSGSTRMMMAWEKRASDTILLGKPVVS